ncbi:hypothetical protein [Nocardia salmonicida]|uniref:hypothetical protein n=1 Tax=Nocardia salmonicida TaxID=53431 RepID=UPI0033C49E9D
MLALFRDTIDFKIGQSATPPTAQSEADRTCSDDYYGATTGWGPDRPTNGTNDWSSQPSFNVERENPNYGDERNFIISKDAAVVEAGGWNDEVQVRMGSEYIVRAYIHNGARNREDYVARNTRIRIQVPQCVGRSMEVRSVIEASNSYPTQIWDGTILRSVSPFKLEFVYGSGQLSTISSPSGIPLPDSVFDPEKGALIGSTALDGNFGGDYVNSGVVTVRVKAVPA